jgi:hypothetical protein
MIAVVSRFVVLVLRVGRRKQVDELHPGRSAGVKPIQPKSIPEEQP